MKRALVSIVGRLLITRATGFESHFIAGSVPQSLGESMRQFTDLGLQVPLTELDVRVRVDGNDQATPEALQLQ